MKQNFLMHHGVLGQKWGVRRYQNYDGTRIRNDGKPNDYSYSESGGYLPKGSRVTRVATNKNDQTYGNKKHVSTNSLDESIWEKELADRYASDPYKNRGFDPYIVEYETTKDLKVASKKEAGELFINTMLSDPEIAEQSFSDIRDSYNKLSATGFEITEDYLKYPDLMGTVSIALQTETGKKFCDELIASGYDAVADTHGTNTAKDPVIILDPDKNLKRVSETKYIKENQNGTVFVSGSSKTQMKDSPYYRKSLPRDIQTSLDGYMRDNKKIVVGDAPGIDRQVQDYLAKKKYSNVEIYGPGKQVRYSANDSWKTNPIDSNYEEGSKEWLAQKDIMMSTVATEGLAVVLPEGSKATRKNIERLIADNKDVKVYELNVDSTKDRWR